MSKGRLRLAAVCALVSACTAIPDRNEAGGAPADTGAAAATAPGAGAPDELGATLNVSVVGDTARIELYVTNVTSGPIALEFTSAQRYDVEVSNAAGERLWRWADEMMFAQVLGREVIRAGESLSYGAAWAAPAPGDYIAAARVVSTNYPVELRTSFRIPAD